jgi:hypothetical protein
MYAIFCEQVQNKLFNEFGQIGLKLAEDAILISMAQILLEIYLNQYNFFAVTGCRE